MLKDGTAEAGEIEIGGLTTPDAHMSVPQARAPKQRGRRKAASAALDDGTLPRRLSKKRTTRPEATGSACRTRQDGQALLDDEIGGHSEVDAIPGVHSRNVPIQRGEGQPSPAVLHATIARIVMLQRERVFCIRQINRSKNAVNAYVARLLGYHADLPAKQGKALWSQAIAYREQVERPFREAAAARKKGKGKAEIVEDEPASEGSDAADEGSGEVLVSTEPTGFLRMSDLSASHRLIVEGFASRQIWEDMRAEVEKQMEKLVKTLPVWSWATTVSGLGAKGVAIIIAEAGTDLRNYATKERLWKRLGLAVINGERQRKVSKTSDPEGFKEHLYSPARRAEMWTLADSMFRQQWAGEKDGVPAHAKGPYGEIYARRKAHTMANRDWKQAAHFNNDAKRIMWKAVLKHLWQAWKRTWPKDAGGVP